MARKKQERGLALGRLLRILATLEERHFGVSIEDLAKETGYNKRTIYRDIKILISQGFDLQKQIVKQKIHWRLGKDFKSPKMPFTTSELLSIYFARGLLKPLQGTPFYEGIESAIGKIRTMMPEKTRNFDFIVDNTFIATIHPLLDYKKYAQLLSLVSDACQKQIKVRIEYLARSSGETNTHIFHPYLIKYYEGTLYCIGFSELRNGVRTLAIERIKNVEFLKEGFETKDDFDPKAYSEESFGIMHDGDPVTVRIEFSETIAPIVKERTWHSSQKLKELKDGRVEVTMQVVGISDVLRWILRFGSDAKVIEPKELIDSIQEQIKTMSKLYNH